MAGMLSGLAIFGAVGTVLYFGTVAMSDLRRGLADLRCEIRMLDSEIAKTADLLNEAQASHSTAYTSWIWCEPRLWMAIPELPDEAKR